MGVQRVLLARPRGFCAGVQMAIKALSWMVRVFEPPVYCYHEIVHNQVVVERFRRLGVIFVDDIKEVPAGAPLMLSAHGTAPEVAQAARDNSRVVVNAVCPLVTKVHHEVKSRSAKGYQILYVGHRGHDEAVGTMAVAPSSMHLVESEEDLAGIEDSATPLALIAQTTLSVHDWSALAEKARQRFGELWMPAKSDLCFATTNRQTALAELAKVADSVVVLGSANSSNTVSLAKVARLAGVERVYRVNGADELPDDLSGTVALTAGASAPEDLVKEVIAALDPLEGTELVEVVDEDEYFPPPRELRELLRALAAATSLSFALAGQAANPVGNDRSTEASEVLEDLLKPAVPAQHS